MDNNTIMTAVTRMKNTVKKPVEPPIITIEDTYGTCCCCRELPCVKNIWSKYEWMGQLEVYGEMIQECFGIAWPQAEERRYQICEVCIAQLRTALQFKRCIQKSHEALKVAVPTIKVEAEEPKSDAIGPDADTQHMVTDNYVSDDIPHNPLHETENQPTSDTHQPKLTYNDPTSVNSERKDIEECVLNTDIVPTAPLEQCTQNETEPVKDQTVQKPMTDSQKKAKEKSPIKRMSEDSDGPSKLRKDNEDKLEAEAAEAALYLESCDPYNVDGISQPPSVQSNAIGDQLPLSLDDAQNNFLMLADQTNSDSGVMCPNDDFDMGDVLDDEDLVPSLYASDNNNVILMDTACSDVSDQVAFENAIAYNSLNTIEHTHVCPGKHVCSVPEETIPVSEVKKQETHKSNIEDKLLQHNITPKNYTVIKSPKGRPADVCYYCRNFTFTLSRHMSQHHPDEPEVQAALKHPKNSLERRQCLALLRNKGNLFCKTVRTPENYSYKFKSQAPDVPSTPCSQCGSTGDALGKPGDTTKPEKKDLLSNVILNEDLLNKVFTHLNSDKICFVAKEDKLICMLGAQYYLTHQKEHNCLVVVSRKMKELANLLVEVATSNPNVVSLEQALKPQNYDIVVRAIKTVARYDDTIKKFEIPHYTMNIVTSLKECCRIAVTEISKMDNDENTAKTKEDMNAFSTLFEKYWKFVISDPNSKNCKPHLVSIAADLKLLKGHLRSITAPSIERLLVQKNKRVTAFNDLVEAAYCHVALLNRCEHNELQKLTLNDYHGINENNKPEQFKKFLSLTEKVLIKKLKMIVVRDEKDRPVPVLFNTDVQKDIKFFLSVRHYYIPDGNNMLFKLAGGATLYGDKALLRYAKACGAKNFKILTSPNLQKYVATISLLLSMSETVLIKVVKFLGLSIQNDSSQSPSDDYHIAKISRLLLLMEDGRIAQYHGKALHEIYLDMDEEIGRDKERNKEVTNVHIVETPECSDMKKKVTAVYFVDSLQECTKLSEAGTKFMETLPESSNLNPDVGNVNFEETLPECSNLNQEATNIQFVQPMAKSSNLNQDVTNIHFVQPMPQPSNLSQQVTNIQFLQPMPKCSNLNQKVTNIHFVQPTPQSSDLNQETANIQFAQPMPQPSNLNQEATNIHFVQPTPQSSNLNQETANIQFVQPMPQSSNLNQEATNVQFVQPLPKCSNLNQEVANVHFVKPIPQPSKVNQKVSAVHFASSMPECSNISQEVSAVNFVPPIPECSNLSQEVSAVNFAPPMQECPKLSQEMSDAHFAETLPECSNLNQDITDANFMETLPECSNINEPAPDVNFVQPLPEYSNLGMRELLPYTPNDNDQSWESSHEIILDMAQW